MTSTEKRVTNLAISENEAALMWCAVGDSDYIKQIDRFEVLGFSDSDKNPLHADFVGGTLYWCETGLEALALRDFERASGFDANLLWDLWAKEGEPGNIVQSARPWAQMINKSDSVRALSSFVE